MGAMGVPGMLLSLVIVLEVVGGLALIAGFKTGWATIALAAFTVLVAILLHTDFGDQAQMILFMKNWVITGGLLMVYLYGAGELSMDRQLGHLAFQSMKY